MSEKRFFYSKSVIYGWCVYDRDTFQTPAYEACADLLPPVSDNEEGRVCESPICESEFQAMRLCARLNIAWKRYLKDSSK